VHALAFGAGHDVHDLSAGGLVVQARGSGTEDLAERYLDLLQGCLTRLAFPDRYRPISATGRHRVLASTISPVLSRSGVVLVERARSGDDRLTEEGRDWPLEAETMIGLERLKNLRTSVRTLVDEGIEGDLIETGVWRGGASIFLRAALVAYGDPERTVWVADSFEGLPPPDPAFPADRGDRHHERHQLAVSLEEVQANFRRYGLLDDRVRFLKGWFKDTLPSAPIERLALLRLDGDMYGSTMDALAALYPKLSVGGFVIVDDYALRGAREAVTDFRRDHGIDDPLEEIDWTGVAWRRSG
jgi:O-methyltransferase